MAGSNAFAALDTFRIADFFDVHFAVPDAGAAVVAFFFIDPHAEQGKFMKQPVKGAQRTKKPAEKAEDKNGRQQNSCKQQYLPLKKSACKLPQAFVFDKQRDTALECAGGADILRWPGVRFISGIPITKTASITYFR